MKIPVQTIHKMQCYFSFSTIISRVGSTTSVITIENNSPYMITLTETKVICLKSLRPQPPDAFSAHKVHVDMEYLLTGISVGIDNKSETAFCDPLYTCNF